RNASSSPRSHLIGRRHASSAMRRRNAHSRISMEDKVSTRRGARSKVGALLTGTLGHARQAQDQAMVRQGRLTGKRTDITRAKIAEPLWRRLRQRSEGGAGTARASQYLMTTPACPLLGTRDRLLQSREDQHVGRFPITKENYHDDANQTI